MTLFHWVSPQRGKNPGRTHRPRAGSCRLAGVALAGRGRCCPGRPGPAAADPETGETQQPRGAARPTNQRSPGTQPGERLSGPIRNLAARCVTGCTPHAVANQRAPRPDRADVAERAREPRARARGFPLPLARARGGRVRKREERRGEGRRGGGGGAEAGFPRRLPPGVRDRGSVRFPPRGIGGAAPPGPASDARGRAERRAGPRAL